MMIDVPLPGEQSDDCCDDNFLSAAMIPVVGAVPGILLAVLGVLLEESVAGSIIWAFAAVIVSELITSGRADKFAAAGLAKLIFKEAAESFVNSAVTFVMLFKLAAFYFIAYSENTGFAVLLFVLMFTLEMYLVTFPERNALLELEEDGRKKLYLLPAAVLFIWFWSFPLAALFSAAAAWGTALFFRKKVWGSEHRITPDDVTLCAGCAEICILVCAIIFLG